MRRGELAGMRCADLDINDRQLMIVQARADHPHSGTTCRTVRGMITDAAPAIGVRRCGGLAIEEKAPWRSVSA